jgi:DNA-binding MarR family transcriptional regulator
MNDDKFHLLAALIDEATRMRGRSASLFAAINAETGLTDIEMTVLNAVAGASTAPTVPRIGRSLGHPRQVIQRAANTLTSMGLVAPEPNPDHKRALLLTLTPQGRAVKRKADTLARRLAEPVIRNLEAAALEAAVRALHDVRVAIDATSRPHGATRQTEPSLSGANA